MNNMGEGLITTSSHSSSSLARKLRFQQFCFSLTLWQTGGRERRWKYYKAGKKGKQPVSCSKKNRKEKKIEEKGTASFIYKPVKKRR